MSCDIMIIFKLYGLKSIAIYAIPNYLPYILPTYSILTLSPQRESITQFGVLWAD